MGLYPRGDDLSEDVTPDKRGEAESDPGSNGF